MADWFTGDHHFDHRNIIEYSNRPFKDTNHMNEEMIEIWNSIIKPKDVVYHLGDLMWKRNLELLKRLNGNIKLIKGNHDCNWGGYAYETASGLLVEEQLIVERHISKTEYIVMCHYPMLQWNHSFRGSIHLHAHSHGNIKNEVPNSMDVGVDTNNFKPYSLEEILDRFKSQNK